MSPTFRYGEPSEKLFWFSMGLCGLGIDRLYKVDHLKSARSGGGIECNMRVERIPLNRELGSGYQILATTKPQSQPKIGKKKKKAKTNHFSCVRECASHFGGNSLTSSM